MSPTPVGVQRTSIGITSIPAACCSQDVDHECEHKARPCAHTFCRTVGSCRQRLGGVLRMP